MLLNSPSKIISSSCGEKNANVVLIMKIHLLHLKYHGRGAQNRKLFCSSLPSLKMYFYFHFKQTLVTSQVACLLGRVHVAFCRGCPLTPGFWFDIFCSKYVGRTRYLLNGHLNNYLKRAVK